MKKDLVLSGSLKLSKELKERLMNKILDKNDDKIIALMEQRNSHIQAIKRIDSEISDLTSLSGLE